MHALVLLPSANVDSVNDGASMSTLEGATYGPMTDERAIQLYAQFRQNLHNQVVSDGVSPPELSNGEPMDGSVFLFESATSDTLREIGNSVNQFLRWINTLAAWRPIYDGLDQGERLSILVQHVGPYSTLALGAPQALRGRLIYAAATSCGHANHALHRDPRLQWHGGHVRMTDVSRIGQPWSRWPALAAALNEIGQGDFSEDTSDFRNQREHGHPRNVGMGLTASVSVRIEDGSRVVGFGSRDAISLDDVIRLSIEQHALVCRAYRAFCDLAVEQFSSLQAAFPGPCGGAGG